MHKHHPENERIKREYLLHLEEAMGMAASTLSQVAAHIASFEASTNYRDFKLFHIEQARKFKRILREQTHVTTGKPLAVSTINSRLKALRAFFLWLAEREGYRSRLKYADAEYFNDSNNSQRIAAAEREQAFPTIPEIRKVLTAMPYSTEINSAIAPWWPSPS